MANPNVNDALSPVKQLAKPGFNVLTLVTSTTEFDPTDGFQNVDTYEGSEAACTAQLGTLAARQSRGRVYQVEGPVWRLDVRYGKPKSSSDTGVEVPNDQWTFSKEFVQVDMRNHPNIISMVAEVSADPPATLNRWIFEIDELIKDGNGLPSIVTGGQYTELYALRSFGQKAFEVERLTLRRERTTTTQFADPAKFEGGIGRMFTTAALIAAYNIPTTVSARIPATPAFTPAYHAWAWKSREEETQLIPGIGKVQERRGWVFAAWPTRIYTLVS